MFQDRIRESYDGLTPGFRKLADFIMESTLDSAFLTATELSRRVGVDPATVVRFAQELGYSGYRELSREIKRYVRDQVTATYRQASEAETTEALLNALVANTQQNMQHFVTTDLGNVIEVVEALSEAPRIWFTGEFAGYDLASFIAKQFKTYGVVADAFHPSMGETASVIAQMEEGDALVAFAGLEPNIDTGYAVRMARDKGVHTITITNSGIILPAREAHTTVIVPSNSPAEVASFGLLMQIVGLIWEALMSKQGEKTAERQNELHANMESLLELRANTPDYEIPTPKNLGVEEE